jgi:hypothetical protein
MIKVHRVKDKKDLIRYYRIIPYSELVEILKEDGEAFFEDSSEQRLKRQTVWKAARRLSEMLGKKVEVKRALLRVQNGESLEGYAFSLAEEP